jgi:hypothetical protein
VGYPETTCLTLMRDRNPEQRPCELNMGGNGHGKANGHARPWWEKSW